MNSPAVVVKVSAKNARLQFAGCSPAYIANVCKARCCESSQAPAGIIVAIHACERPVIEALGGTVIGGLLQPAPGTRRCPFKQANNLCGLHGGPDKPFGCIASPFTLNHNSTLIVRNRYKLLRCYRDGARLPAYVAFRASLDMLFGLDTAAIICAHLDGGGGDIFAPMPRRHFDAIRDNDAAKRNA